MKAVILAGGKGTRISEESHLRPKPMIEIGGRPILWHIMNIYSQHGVNDFIIALGYRGAHDQGVFRQLCAVFVGRDGRRAARRDHLSPELRRALARHAWWIPARKR